MEKIILPRLIGWRSASPLRMLIALYPGLLSLGMIAITVDEDQ